MDYFNLVQNIIEDYKISDKIEITEEELEETYITFKEVEKYE